ncbi:hypothetical protein FBUS_08597 [Fasciolopsis buskii]|uniref:Uncharacterized protein n=1 Tax=Fasciolopsis buskii TaxID=27845 RepID=A0A8E0VFD8_9TREM|nr:hypothetical protein FBUS_08597 [Fasciolopsis buski]
MTGKSSMSAFSSFQVNSQDVWDADDGEYLRIISFKAAQKTAQKVIDSHKKETSNLRPSGVSELIDRVFLCIFTCFWLSSTLSFGVVYFVCYVHAKRNHGFFAANADTRQL